MSVLHVLTMLDKKLIHFSPMYLADKIFNPNFFANFREIPEGCAPLSNNAGYSFPSNITVDSLTGPIN